MDIPHFPDTVVEWRGQKGYLSVNSPAPELTARVKLMGKVKVRDRVVVRVRVRVMVSASVRVNKNNSGAGELTDKYRQRGGAGGPAPFPQRSDTFFVNEKLITIVATIDLVF